jgi:tRNA(adenine34) deaminase
MRQCIEIGRQAARRGESPVGSIVIRAGRVLAEASEATRSSMDVTAHAEVLAIRKATQEAGSVDLRECTLFTNVEPCVLCSYAIRRTGIERVVIGAPTDALGGVSSKHPILVETDIPGFGSPPKITQGVLLEECLALLKG